MPSLLKIGELAKQTGLSIRTLHYYDEIGLLTPAHRTEADHRLYNDQDIIRLQQILSLRQLGFTLSEIQECLDEPDYSLPKVIDLHRSRLRAQIDLSQTLLSRLNGIAKELATTQSIAVENLIETMETITMTTQFFTPEQHALLNHRLQEREAEWQDLLIQINEEMAKGTDINSAPMHHLARRWLGSMKAFVRGDSDIYAALTQLYREEGSSAESWGGMDAATFETMLKAVSFLTLGEVTEALTPVDKLASPETLQVIQRGEAAIRAINFDFLGTEGFLLGLLADDANLAGQVLRQQGLTLSVVQPLVAKWLGVHPELPQGWQSPNLPLALRARRVFELALKRAQANGRSLIEPTHLLLGILDEVYETGGGLATYILKEELGVDLARLEQQVLAAIAAE